MQIIPFTQAFRKEYENLFNSCVIRSKYSHSVESIIRRILENKRRYLDVGEKTGIPWSFIAVIHSMESSLNFTKHLHNGDPLTARTVQVPAGRPAKGNPPFTWEESASDAFSLKGLGSQTDWSLGGTLYQLERYNGWGYRQSHPQVLSPYLWSFSNHYTAGKYIADHKFSDTAVSDQCGTAVLLRRMVETELIEFPDQPAPRSDTPPLVLDYFMHKSADPVIVNQAEELQRWLNTFPGIFVKIDGVLGGHTSEAYKKVTGVFLPGDPRG